MKGPGRGVGLCAAHEEKHPSLSVQESDDGTVLIHCFAGCSAADVVAAIGLSLADLFVQRPADDEGRPRRRKPFLSARDVLDLLEEERVALLTAVSDIRAGRPLAPDMVDRISVAGTRIQAIKEAIR